MVIILYVYKKKSNCCHGKLGRTNTDSEVAVLYSDHYKQVQLHTCIASSPGHPTFSMLIENLGWPGDEATHMH